MRFTTKPNNCQQAKTNSDVTAAEATKWLALYFLSVKIQIHIILWALTSESLPACRPYSWLEAADAVFQGKNAADAGKTAEYRVA